ncbi:hypothetical protein [Verrucomicrobium sp. BvORR034]|uniref:hypothetical protein n=1 Tax=Verrucomicrobium sp. BvORR034 TaxID=1396418 RepID=UPI00067862E0|nr:hypothetical protein [Verrucomicrobium sp. BvORR034]
MPSAPLDPLDLTAFRLEATISDGVAKKVLTVLPIRKPAKDSFVRTHLDPQCWMVFGLIELQETSRIYLVDPKIVPALQERGEATFFRAHLVLTVDRKGNPFLWPLKFSAQDNIWHISARGAAEKAREKWVRVTSNRAAGCYDAAVAENQDAEPLWPDMEYKELLRLAFGNRTINSLEHPVLLELRGA